MPNFNKGKFIAEAIDSVLKQSFVDFELLIVDDASTDNSLDVCGDYAKREQRIRLFQSEKRKGVSASRNRGITEANADVVAFIDSDDVYAPTKLAKQYEFFKLGKRFPVVYCDRWRMNQDGAVLPPRHRSFPSGMIFGDVLLTHSRFSMTYMASRSALLKADLFDSSLPWAEDYDMVLKLVRTNEFQYIDSKPSVPYARFRALEPPQRTLRLAFHGLRSVKSMLTASRVRFTRPPPSSHRVTGSWLPASSIT